MNELLPEQHPIVFELARKVIAGHSVSQDARERARDWQSS
jgi:hypothetical protein